MEKNNRNYQYSKCFVYALFIARKVQTSKIQFGTSFLFSSLFRPMFNCRFFIAIALGCLWASASEASWCLKKCRYHLNESKTMGPPYNRHIHHFDFAKRFQDYKTDKSLKWKIDADNSLHVLHLQNERDWKV